MSKVLVLYYSSYGHIETMAEAVAEGARSTGATVDIKRIPETVPQEVAEAAHFKLDQKAPVAVIAELAGKVAVLSRYLEGSALRIVNLPKYHRVDIHRYGVLAQRLFSVDFRGLDTLIEPGSHVIDKRHDDKQTGATNCG